MFGNQSTTSTPSAFGFSFGNAPAPTALASTVGQASVGTGSFSFGAPSFNFGNTVSTTSSQTPALGQTFSFGGGPFNLAMTTAQATTSTPSLFGFTNPASSINASTGLSVSKSQSNFSFFPAQQSNTMASQSTPFNLTQQGLAVTTSTVNPAASLFWNPSNTQQTTSSLMSQSFSTPFGVAPSNTTPISTPAPFGLSSNATSNLFGSTIGSTTTGTTPFGTTSAAASTTGFSFGAPATTSTPLFGQVATGFGTTSSAPAPGIGSGSIFGASSMFAPQPSVVKSEPTVTGPTFNLTSQPISSTNNFFGFGLSLPSTATTSTVATTVPAPSGFPGFSMTAPPTPQTSTSLFPQPASTIATMPPTPAVTNVGLGSSTSATSGFSFKLPTAQTAPSSLFGTPNLGMIAPTTTPAAAATTAPSSSGTGFNFTGFSKPTPTFFPPATTTPAQASTAPSTQPATSFFAPPPATAQTTNAGALFTLPTPMSTGISTTGGFNVAATPSGTTLGSSLSKGPAVTSLFFPPPAPTSATTVAPIVASAPGSVGMGSLSKPIESGQAQASTAPPIMPQAVTTTTAAPPFKFDVPPISKFGPPAITSVSISAPAASSIASSTISGMGLTFPTPLGTTSIASQAPTASQGQSTTAVMPIQEPVPSVMNYRQLGDCITNWKLDFEDMERAFVDQAVQINVWETLVRTNGKKLNKLSGDVECARLDEERISQQLDFMASQQDEVNTMLLALENEYGTGQGGPDSGSVPKTLPKLYMGGTVMNADSEREETFSMAEQIDLQLNYMEQSLKDLVEDVNGLDSGTLAASKDSTDGSAVTATQITQILNTHLDLLRWIENNIETLKIKLQEMSFQSFVG